MDTRSTRKALVRTKLAFHPDNFIYALYRPFVKRTFYYDPDLNWSLYRMPNIFPEGSGRNKAIFFSDRGARSPFSVLATNQVAELHLCASTDGFQSVPLYQISRDGRRLENITDWALEQFQAHYRNSNDSRRPITKDAIFHYVYGVLHDPAYREKYALNLKREFPRIPFYDDFWRWAEWGERLMALHIGYEAVEPWPLQRIDIADEKSRKAGLTPKPLLRANKAIGNIALDT